MLCYQARVPCRLEAVVYNPEEAQQLEATVGSEKAEVQRCRERVDDLSSHLPGMYFCYAGCKLSNPLSQLQDQRSAYTMLVWFLSN